MENYATKNTDVFLSARRFPEYEEIGICRREPFQRDRDRIMHSRSFRRMMHKTQIFNANMGDHYRNRLTHTLEVAQISRSIGKVLGLNDELIEAIALGHDLGHTPFGHIGERTLDGILHNGLNTNIPATGGRFKHNFQSLKVVDQLETRCEDYAGINLTLATREGILKHTNNVYMHGIPKGKIIRDAVHGDIFVEDKFLKIIDTPEFQRMRRIKQLSVANIVFPSADHTRFSHSLGCFYVMKQIIAHFDSIFGKMGIEVSKQDKDIALLAALLHDIGHGPFSHAFEDIHPKGAAQVSHETWTSRIITCHSGTIYKQIEETFGKGTAEKVSELIEKQRRVKSSEENYIIEKIDIFSVLSSLISSQLDADRLDYLVRDAYNCGVSFGKIDIQRIISALSLTVYDNQYYVCVPEKYIGDIEDC